MPWQKKSPDLTNNPLYLEPRVTAAETSLADNTNKVNILIQMKANPLFYGAKGDGTTDDTLAVQNAINSMPNGGILEVPNNDFLLKGSNPQLLLIQRPIKIEGKGFYSRFLIDSSVPATTDVLRLSPDTSFAKDFGGMEGIHITPSTGSPARYGVHFDVTNAGQYISRYIMEGNTIHALGSYGINLTNPTNVDGFFASFIKENLIYGGINLQRSGDSNTIEKNTITGQNIGINISCVSGAVQTVIEKNNITNIGGAIKTGDTGQLKIRYNQIEQTQPYVGTENACISIGAIAADNFNVEIKGNNINGHGANIQNLIKVGYAQKCVIDENVMNVGSAEMIVTTSNALNTIIGRGNTYKNNSAVIPLSFIDDGVGTIGILKNPTLLNAWVNNSSQNYPNAGYYKDNTGMVHLTGVITSGTTTLGTTIFTLPVGFRPPRSITVNIDNNGAYGNLLILATGEVQTKVTGNTFVSLEPASFYTVA